MKKRGRPRGTTQEAEYCACISDSRPRGTTQEAGFAVTHGRSKGTTRDAGSNITGDRPCGRRRNVHFIQLPTHWDCSEELVNIDDELLDECT